MTNNFEHYSNYLYINCIQKTFNFYNIFSILYDFLDVKNNYCEYFVFKNDSKRRFLYLIN